MTFQEKYEGAPLEVKKTWDQVMNGYSLKDAMDRMMKTNHFHARVFSRLVKAFQDEGGVFPPKPPKVQEEVSVAVDPGAPPDKVRKPGRTRRMETTGKNKKGVEI